MEQSWIRIYEDIKRKDEDKNWLIEILEEDNIPYRTEIEAYWEGSYKSPKYREKIVIYIPKEFKVKVEDYIKEFNNPKNLITENIEELKNVSDRESEELEEEINKRQHKMNFWIAIIVLGMVFIPILIASIL